MNKEKPVDVVKHYINKYEQPKSQEQLLMDSYAEAVKAGYQGTYEDFKRIMQKKSSE